MVSIIIAMNYVMLISERTDGQGWWTFALSAGIFAFRKLETR